MKLSLHDEKKGTLPSPCYVFKKLDIPLCFDQNRHLAPRKYL